MGLFFSTLHIFKSFSQLFLIHDVGEVVIQNNITPLCFLRQDDYTSYGEILNHLSIISIINNPSTNKLYSSDQE